MRSKASILERKNCPAFMIQRGQWDAFLKGTNAYYNEHRKEVIPPEVPHEKTTLQVVGMNKTFVN